MKILMKDENLKIKVECIEHVENFENEINELLNGKKCVAHETYKYTTETALNNPFSQAKVSNENIDKTSMLDTCKQHTYDDEEEISKKELAKKPKISNLEENNIYNSYEKINLKQEIFKICEQNECKEQLNGEEKEDLLLNDFLDDVEIGATQLDVVKSEAASQKQSVYKLETDLYLNNFVKAIEAVLSENAFVYLLSEFDYKIVSKFSSLSSRPILIFYSI
jgi:hypothetical protein